MNEPATTLGLNFPASASCLFPPHMASSFWILPQASFVSRYCVVVRVYILITETFSLLWEIFSFYHHSSWRRRCSFSPPNFPFTRWCYAMGHAQGRLTPAGPPSVPGGGQKKIWKWQTWKPWILAFLLEWVSPSLTWPCSTTQSTWCVNHPWACCHLGPSQVPQGAQSHIVTKHFHKTRVRGTRNERFGCNLKNKSTCWLSRLMESRLAFVLSAENSWQIRQRLNRKYCLLF